MSNLPSPSAMKAFTPVVMVAAESAMLTGVKVSWVGFKAGSKLKNQSTTDSASTRPLAERVSRTSFGPPTESSKVAVSQGVEPSGAVPVPNKTLNSNVRVVAPATGAKPSANASANPRSQMQVPLPNRGYSPIVDPLPGRRLTAQQARCQGCSHPRNALPWLRISPPAACSTSALGGNHLQRIGKVFPVSSDESPRGYFTS